ncbi:DoxX family membrane protein [Microbacteriaceae bacterium 4G12]
MFADFLRNNGKMALFLTFIRVYMGLVWMTHGWQKISGKTFDATGFLKEAITRSSGPDAVVQGWWAFIVKYLFLSNVEILNYLIPLGEFFVGLGLVLGCFTNVALYCGLIMNFSYLLSGSLDVNPQLILLSLLLLGSHENAGKIGVDGLIFKSIKRRMSSSSSTA